MTDPAPQETARAEAPEPPEPATSVDESNDMLGFHFKRLLGGWKAWAVIVPLVLLAAAIGFAVKPVFGLAGAAIVLVISGLVVYLIASAAATDTFLDAYAGQREMVHSDRGPLPAATPLLRRGDDRYAEHSLRGPLADGVEGTLALYTYEDSSYDSDGNRQTNYYRYTVGLCEVPECAQRVPSLFARRKFGLKSLEKVEDAFRSVERVKLESEALDERYEIFVGPGQDAVWLRRLFAPTFIVWLTDSAPQKFAFELVDGSLCCYVKGHRKKAEGLDRMRAATAAVATRLREESLES